MLTKEEIEELRFSPDKKHNKLKAEIFEVKPTLVQILIKPKKLNSLLNQATAFIDFKEFIEGIENKHMTQEAFGWNNLREKLQDTLKAYLKELSC